eukprot:TRINITY_DN6472_c0_g1_i5.p1 TRINITY_DN6472_c0_g1~~TRINITY_DN6472_c0_g1_i5.p1  ORF type:complete len:135 (+),score=27.34 TRINITY_DN6472_c0_g1_i5:488-892(+)
MYYRNADAALVVYDVSDPSSWERVTSLVKELQDKANDDILILIIGNKFDLYGVTSVPFEDVQQYGEENKFITMMASAKTGENVSDIFEGIGNQLHAKPSKSKYSPMSTTVDLRRSTNEQQNSNSWCSSGYSCSS